MRLFVLGAPCSGKSTVAQLLRTRGIASLDADDEIVRLNGGVWPSDFETKNERLLPQVLDLAESVSTVVLFNSYMPLAYSQRLRGRGFAIALLEVPELELRRRDQIRQAEEGWTNIEWFDWHQDVIREHRDAGLVDLIVDGERLPEVVADELARLTRRNAHEPA